MHLRTVYRLILIASAPLLLVVTFLYLWYGSFNTRHWKQFELTDSAERERSSYYKVTLDYPPEWTTSDIEYLDLNTDIFFKTGTEDYEVKIFVGTWKEPNGCGSYKQDKEYYDVMSCSSSTNEKFTLIEGEYYDKKDEQKFVYQKDIYFHDRAFEFRVLATEYEDLDFPKKVARFFSAERINIDQIPESPEEPKEQAINKIENIDAISKPGDIQPTVDSLTTKDKYMVSQACINYSDEERTKKFFSQNSSYEESMFDGFFMDDQYLDLLETGELFQICLRADTIGFVLYGEYVNDNNLVGMYRDGKYVSVTHNVPNAGDISVCSISGFVEDVLIYSCGGGDGGGGWNKVYTLDFINAESQLIKDCEFYLEDNTCANNVLGITEHPQARYFDEAAE